MTGNNNVRGGVPSLLTGARFLLKFPPFRYVIKPLSSEISVNGERRKIAYEALRLIVEEDTESCFIVRFYSKLLKTVFDLAVKYFNGNREEVYEALKDPSIRRGLALVLEGLALYGITVPQKLPAPFLVVWNFTNMCNLKCKHCYQKADRPTPDELTLNEKLDVIRQLDEAGVAAVAFSGGEPTIHPDFPIVLKAAADAGMYTALATNGIRLADRKYAEKLRKLGLRYVEISVDSADPDKHDAFRGVKGAWKKTVQGVKNAVELGFSTAIATTVTKINLDEISDIIDLAEELGVERVVFFNFIPVGRGKDLVELDLTPEEREELLRKLYLENQRRKVQVFSTAPQFARVSLEMSGGKDVAPTHFYVRGDPIVAALAEYIGGCGAGRIYAAIEPNGDLTPCVFIPNVVVGNLGEEKFSVLWKNAPVFNALRDRSKLEENCKHCPYKYVCGGCRARALAYTGNILGPDPGCINNADYFKTTLSSVKNTYRDRLLKVELKP